MSILFELYPNKAPYFNFIIWVICAVIMAMLSYYANNYALITAKTGMVSPALRIPREYLVYSVEGGFILACYEFLRAAFYEAVTLRSMWKEEL